MYVKRHRNQLVTCGMDPGDCSVSALKFLTFHIKKKVVRVK